MSRSSYVRLGSSASWRCDCCDCNASPIATTAVALVNEGAPHLQPIDGITEVESLDCVSYTAPALNDVPLGGPVVRSVNDRNTLELTIDCGSSDTVFKSQALLKNAHTMPPPYTQIGVGNAAHPVPVHKGVYANIFVVGDIADDKATVYPLNMLGVHLDAVWRDSLNTICDSLCFAPNL